MTLVIFANYERFCFFDVQENSTISAYTNTRIDPGHVLTLSGGTKAFDDHYTLLRTTDLLTQEIL